MLFFYTGVTAVVTIGAKVDAELYASNSALRVYMCALMPMVVLALALMMVVTLMSGHADGSHDVRPRHWCGEPHHHHRCRQALPVQKDRAARRGLHLHALAPSAPGVRGVCVCSVLVRAHTNGDF